MRNVSASPRARFSIDFGREDVALVEKEHKGVVPYKTVGIGPL